MRQATGLSYKKNISMTVIGNIVYAVSQWAIVMFMTKFGDVEMVGKYSLALAITAPLFMLTNFQLRAVQATDTQSEYHFGKYLGLRIWSVLMTVIIVIFVVMIGKYEGDVKWIILLIGLTKAIESISDVIFGLLQKNERLDKVGYSYIVKGPASMIVFGLTLFITGNLIYSIIGMALVWGVILVFYDMAKGKEYSSMIPVFHWRELIPLFKVSFPLGIVMMLISLNDNIPRLFIEYHVGMEELGYYSSIVYVTVAGNIIIGALGQSFTPRLARYYQENIKAFSKLIIKMQVIGILVGITGIFVVFLFGDMILAIMYSFSYIKYKSVFVLIMIAASLNYISSLFGYAITAARAFKVQPYLFGFITCVSFCSNYLLVPIYGLEGAVFSFIITSIFQIIGSVLIIYFIIKK